MVSVSWTEEPMVLSEQRLARCRAEQRMTNFRKKTAWRCKVSYCMYKTQCTAFFSDVSGLSNFIAIQMSYLSGRVNQAVLIVFHLSSAHTLTRNSCLFWFCKLKHCNACEPHCVCQPCDVIASYPNILIVDTTAPAGAGTSTGSLMR